MSIDNSELQRLVPHWSPGVWIGAVKRAFGPVNELVAGSDGVLVDSHPPHSLLVLWKPPKAPLQPPFLRRYPWMVSIDAVSDADAALRARFEKNLQAFLSLAEAAKHYPCIKRAWVEFLGQPPGAAADRVDPVSS